MGEEALLDQAGKGMKLRLWNESGEEETSGVEAGPAGQAAIAAAVKATDWAAPEISGVTLESAVGWADGSGSLDASVGLSLMVEQYGVQHVGVSAPARTEEIVSFLEAYLAGDLRKVFEQLYERAPTDEELAAFEDPSPQGGNGTWVMVALAFIVLLVLLGAVRLLG
ncbi:MAG: hypothetical protein AB8H86_21030 [Polyangiales bacterium]